MFYPTRNHTTAYLRVHVWACEAPQWYARC